MMSARRLEAAGERELLAGFRLRTAAIARNAAWITLAGVAALTTTHHSPADLGNHWLVWTLLGAPCITLPSGNGPQGLPLGIQLVGAMEQDTALLAHALWAQRALG